MRILFQPLSRTAQAVTALTVLTCLTLYLVTGHQIWILDTVDLVFHEAGHAVLFFAPELVVVLGGTLLQLAVPTMCLVYFHRTHDLIGSSCMLWWLGQNFLGVSVYIADARAQALPLLGDGHDWAYLLREFNVLAYDTVLAQAVFFIGALCMFGSIALLGRHVWPSYQHWF